MDNTVGSLTQYKLSIIIGSVLGDGYLRIIKGRKNAFLEINHSIKARKYVDWKYKALKDICKSPPKLRIIDETRTGYRFFTRQHKEITNIYNIFYKNGKKTIPSSLVLDPLVLAVWFMDDGSKSRKHDVYLNTQQFSINNQRKLLVKLRKLNLRARLNKDKKYYRIRFLKESVPNFNRIIYPYIIDSMKYKLSYDPVETCPKS
ncbi:hypothetical protein CL633_02890 [bacterium]|nr:hypothetical protein [bacterium]|tara:strand:+ start:484 stop:1092 length:609 start_codon:yes stop_codon:yes gene_type:complete